MEENLEILNFFKITKPDIKYYAEFNPETGAIQKVGPDHAFIDVKNKILIPEDVAVSILNGITKMTTCNVDIIENKFYLSEVRSAVKIDDLLHRIVEKKYATFDYPHILLTYHKNKKMIQIEMSELFFGTSKIPKKFLPVSKQRVHWSGDTMLNFYVTAYNDPTIIYETFSVSVNDLKEQNKTILLSSLNDTDFSIFTRRMFKNYALVIK